MMKRILMLSLCLIFMAGCGVNAENPASAEEPPVEQEDLMPSEQLTEVSSSPTQMETPSLSDEPAQTDNSNYIKGVVDMLNEETHQPPEGFNRKSDGVAYGTLTEVEYYSTTTDAMRKCYIYTPPEYDPDTIYPVLYLLHGIGGIHSEWLGGDPNEILSNLIALGETPPMIAVIPNVRAMQNDGYPSDMLGQTNIDAFDNFINDLRDNLMPYIKENYPVSEKREECAIAGLSMGGRESLYIGLSMPEVFGYIGAFSPAPGLLANADLNYPGQLTAEETTLPDKYKSNTLVFICNGNQDGVVHDIPNEYHKALQSNGIEHVYYTIDGGHDFRVWSNGLYYFAGSIFS